MGARVFKGDSDGYQNTAPTDLRAFQHAGPRLCLVWEDPVVCVVLIVVYTAMKDLVYGLAILELRLLGNLKCPVMS